jgi:Flp pilus assembly pilin Flp
MEEPVMFDTEWTTLRYLVGWVQVRVRSVRDGGSESGALTLEWIIIAAAIAIAAVGAVFVFGGEVTKYTSKLP